MGELRAWLRAHGLEQYADAFETNDIDLDILPDLDEGDLEKLGLSLGNRRRLAKALSAGRAADPSTSPGSIAAFPVAPSPAPASPGAGEAERRQVTVMFADMVGSTALSARVDPEILSGIIRRYQNAVASAIGRSGGYVAKFMWAYLTARLRSLRSRR